MSVENISNLNKIFTPPYTVIAKVYDEMMAHVNYKNWAQYIHSILKKQNFKDGTVLDIGCGTGELLKRMQKYDYDLNGCDSSNEMIDIARKKLPHINFTYSALPLLLEIPENEYNIMLCLFDTMNYLPNEDALTNSLQNIYQKMKTPGIFIFDVVTNSYCKEYFQNYQENEVIAKTIAYSRISEFDPNHNTQINYIRVFTGNSVFEEIHRQKIFDLQLIKNVILNQTSFNLVNMLDDFSFQKAKPNSGRVHFLLKKH